MSIFVLNLATLLGLGLGVDYSLLMTSRFREELALRPGRPGPASPTAVRITVATAGRAVFFSGLTVLLGLLGLVLFEFMILRSVGIAGAIVVGLAVAVGADAAAGAPDHPRGPGRPLRGPQGQRGRPGTDGPWSRLARRVMRHPVAVLIPTARVPAPPRLAVPARPVQRTRRHDPAAVGAVAGRVRPAPGRLRGGRVRADRPRHPDDRPGHDAGQPRGAVRLLATARRRTRGSPASTASSTSTRG